MSLAEESRRIHKIASDAAKGSGRDWNKVYLATILANGFDLIEIPEGRHVGPNGPLQAPEPAENNSVTYATPCVIAPKGWQPP